MVSAGPLLEEIMGYTHVESVLPDDDTLMALTRCIDNWAETPGNLPSAPRRSVHIFWNCNEFLLQDVNQQQVVTVPSDEGAVADFTSLMQKLHKIN